MSKLMSTVKRHVTAQETNGKDTLRLFVQTIEHMFGDSGDWTPLAWLIAKSQPKQGQILRRLAGLTLHGFTMSKDEGQASGLRIKAQKGENQGFDQDFLARVSALVDKGVAIQAKEVVALWEAEREEEEFDPKAWAEKLVKAKKYKDHIGLMIAALQAAQKGV